MPRKTTRKQVNKASFSKYKQVAENFYSGADVAKEYEYWNAAGVLIVHSAIAYADAVTIKYGGVKSQGEDHNQVVTLLKEILTTSDENKKAFIHLEKIIAQKTSVSYSGDVFVLKDIDNLWKNLERFRSWAESVLEN